MPFSVDGIDAPAGNIIFPKRGVWQAQISLSTEAPPTTGSRVKIVAGSLSCEGTVTVSGTFASSSEVEIVAGAAGWRKVLLALGGYRADNLVRLSQVLADLSVATQETIVLEPGAERALGYAWARAEGPAATALEDLLPDGWWVGRDGVTHVGARPAPTSTSAPWTVAGFYSPASGSLTFTTQEEHLAAFDVGSILSAEGLPSFTIGSLCLRWARSTIRLTAWR